MPSMDALASGIAAIYPRQIGVAPREMKLLDEPNALDDVLANSTAVSKLGDAQRMVVERMRDKSNWTPTPEALPRGSSFCPDDATLARRITQARAVASAIETTASPGSISEWELGDAQKLTFQRGYPAYWDVPQKPLVNTRPTRLRDALIAIIERYGADDPPPKVNAVRRGTNHGGFDQSTSDASAILHAAIAAYAQADPHRAWDRLEEAYATAARHWGAIPFPHVTLFSRTGPIKKHQPMYAELGGRVFMIGTYMGYAPRRRHVYGPPLACNIMLRRGYDALASVVVNAGLWHGTEDEIAASFSQYWRDGRRFRYDDISSFDTNVSREDQLALAGAAKAKWPHLGHVFDTWLRVERLPVLAGPMLVGDIARLHNMDGQTTSGVLFTSLVGTLLNFARCVAIRSLVEHRTVGDVLRRHDAGTDLTLNWGDDTVVTFEGKAQDWNEASLEIGFPCDLGDGAAFLKKWYTPGRWMPSAVRVFQQTIWNEHGGRTPAIEVFGLHARTLGVEANPNWKTVARFIFDGYPNSALDEWHIRSLEDVRRTVLSPRFMSAFRTDIAANPFVLADKLVLSRASSDAEEMLAYAAAVLGREVELDGYRGLEDLAVPTLQQIDTLARGIYASEALVDLPAYWQHAISLAKGEEDGVHVR